MLHSMALSTSLLSFPGNREGTQSSLCSSCGAAVNQVDLCPQGTVRMSGTVHLDHAAQAGIASPPCGDSGRQRGTEAGQAVPEASGNHRHSCRTQGHRSAQSSCNRDRRLTPSPRPWSLHSQGCQDPEVKTSSFLEWKLLYKKMESRQKRKRW